MQKIPSQDEVNWVGVGIEAEGEEMQKVASCLPF